jgi:hypothetical protein
VLGRKGIMIADKTAVLIYTVAVLFVLLLVFTTVASRGSPVFSDYLCKFTVSLSDQTGGFSEKIPFAPNVILCETKHVLIKDDDKEEILETVAKKMQSCWWMWGRGELEPSPNLLKWDQNKCFTCHSLEMPEEGTPDISLQDVIAYLQDNEVSKGNERYWNYFRGGEGNTIIFNFPSATNADIPIFKDGEFYDVTYVNDVKTSLLGVFLEGAVVGATAGAVVCSPAVIGAVVCAAKGFVLGGVVTSGTKLVKDYFQDDVDGIMLSERGATNDKCSVEIND